MSVVPGGVLARAVTEERHAPRLVERDPGVDHVAKGGLGHSCIFREPVHRFRAEPAAAVLEHLRQIPVIQGRHRGDPRIGQFLAQPAIEIDARLVDPTGALRKRSGPGDREPVGVDPDLGHQCDVLGVPVVVVHRQVAILAVTG